ncbi:hypothetical protein Tco_0464042 [Tanacetum coccineum]
MLVLALYDPSRTGRDLPKVHSIVRKSSALRLYGGGGIPFQLKSDSLPHSHAQNTKTYYWHQDSRIKKDQTKRQRLLQTLIYKIFYQGRLLASFQEDAKYEHVGQDTRFARWQRRSSQTRKRFRDLKIKDNDKGSRSKIT